MKRSLPHCDGDLGGLLGDVVGDVRPRLPGAHHQHAQAGILVWAGVRGGVHDTSFEDILSGEGR